MIQELKIWWRLKGTIKELKAMQFTASVSSVFQLCMLILQGLNQVLPVLTGRAKFWALVGISAVQGIVGILAHWTNPDGTNAKVGYKPASGSL